MYGVDLLRNYRQTYGNADARDLRARKRARRQAQIYDRLGESVTEGAAAFNSRNAYVWNVDPEKGASRKIRGHAGQAASMYVAEALGELDIRGSLKTRFAGMHRDAGEGAHGITAGIVAVSVELRPLHGMARLIDIPVVVKDGYMLQPSVMYHQGAPYVVTQSALDEIMAGARVDQEVETDRKNMYCLPRLAQLADASGVPEVDADFTKCGPACPGCPRCASGVENTASGGVPGAPAPTASGGVPGAPTMSMGADDSLLSPKGPSNELAGMVRDTLASLPTEQRNKYMSQFSSMIDRGMPIDRAYQSLARALGMMTPQQSMTAALEPEETSKSKRKKREHKPSETDRMADHLDDAERKRDDSPRLGQMVKLTKACTMQTRGGGSFDVERGTRLFIVRDYDGTGTLYVARHPDGHDIVVHRALIR